ncbi:MAG TPA: serine hydrolase [Herpetosiphonaceae bacterium]|nr:serine hydrolase [Herpetosiphonaceae bacterium]
MSKRVLILAGLVLVLLLSLLPLRAALFGRDADVSQASTAGQPTSIVTPTTVEATPTAVEVTPTRPPFAFPDGSEIAGTDVGGLSVEAASASVSEALERFDRTVILRGPGLARTLRTEELIEIPEAEELVDRARSGIKEAAPVTLPLKATVDDRAVRAAVEEIAPRVELPVETTVISDAKALTETFTFAYRPGRRVDVEQSARRLAKAVERADGPDRIDLVIEEIKADQLSMAELERVLREHAGFWDGVAGFYVQDLDSGETVAYNADTVFSGASVMKVPIMIFAYSRLGSLDDTQRTWMHKMIIDSENIEANSLLAAAVGGAGTEDALQGVNEMSTMLKDLGLEHTYQLIPYESAEWLIQQARLPGGGPAREGKAPYTAADGYLRTTPGEMGRLFVMLDECARGTGPLLEKVGGKLTGDLCREMIAWLQQPHDAERMVAGLPAGTVVAHKGGWISDMQSDVGIVESPGGRYVAAIYTWRDGYVTDIHATPSPYLGDFSHTIYTFFNPQPLSADAPLPSGQD